MKREDRDNLQRKRERRGDREEEGRREEKREKGEEGGSIPQKCCIH